MCTVCGCSGAGAAHSHETAVGGAVHSHPHTHEHRHSHGHEHSHGHDHADAPQHSHAPGLDNARLVQIEADILADNDAHAQGNRRWLDERGIYALNLMSSPGSGKTTLLVETIRRLQAEVAIAVIEGDQQTSHDAERIRATGAPAVQINTGKGCHLDGHMVGHALEDLRPADNALLLVENVGNLVCPAAFDLGEHARVVVFSVTEGEDKPLKYPDMFHSADVVLLNKIDLLPHLDFAVDQAEANCRRVNPDVRLFRVSARSGEGMADWIDWLRAGLAQQAQARTATVDGLKARIAELERQLAAR